MGSAARYCRRKTKILSVSGRGREVTMKSPLVIVLVAVVLVTVSTLAVMNNACKSSQHAWCAPMSSVRQHINTAQLTAAIKAAIIDFDQTAGVAGWAKVVLLGGSESAPVLGYVFGVIMAFSAVVALALGLFNITEAVNGPRQHRPVIARTVTVETQRRSPVAKEASAAKDVTPVVATAADTKKSKHHKPRVFARQRDNYGYWNARGYAQRGFFFR